MNSKEQGNFSASTLCPPCECKFSFERSLCHCLCMKNHSLCHTVSNEVGGWATSSSYHCPHFTLKRTGRGKHNAPLLCPTRRGVIGGKADGATCSSFRSLSYSLMTVFQCIFCRIMCFNILTCVPQCLTLCFTISSLV